MSDDYRFTQKRRGKNVLSLISRLLAIKGISGYVTFSEEFTSTLLVFQKSLP